MAILQVYRKDPKFEGPLVTNITDPYELGKLYGYTLQPDSPLKNRGLDLRSFADVVCPVKDFSGILCPWVQQQNPGFMK